MTGLESYGYIKPDFLAWRFETICLFIEHPKVVSVFLNKGRKLHTTRSWDFLGLENDGAIRSSSIWKKARFGEDTIIGNLDTG